MSWATAKWLLTFTSEIGGVIALAGFGVSAVRRVVTGLKKQKEDFERFLDALHDPTATVAERSDLGLYLMNMINGLTSLRDVSFYFSVLFLLLGLVSQSINLATHAISGIGSFNSFPRVLACLCFLFFIANLTAAILTERRASTVRIRFEEMWTDILLKHKSRHKKMD